MSPRTPPPLESFAPELMELLIQGSRRRIEIAVPTYRAAVVFQQRLNLLRHRMKVDKHELATVAALAKVGIRWGRDAGYSEVPELRNAKKARRPRDTSTPSKLIVEPYDTALAKAIREAGVEPRTKQPPPPSLDQGGDKSFDDILSKLGKNY